MGSVFDRWGVPLAVQVTMYIGLGDPRIGGLWALAGAQ